MSAASVSSQDEFYSDHQLEILEGYGLTDLASYDKETGPTISQSGQGGDFEASPYGQVLMGTNSQYAAGGFYDKMQLVSDGLLVTDPDHLQIDALSTGHTERYHDFYKGASRHNVLHHQYTAIDASNANGYVVYNGVTKDHWQGETHLTGKSYEFNNLFKGGDYGNHITGGNYGDTLIGGQGDDIINGVGGSNTLYGVGGDNRIDGGEGGSTIFGGTGNDFVTTGNGSNIVVFGNGDNWVVVNQGNVDGQSESNKVILGSGTDTVVLGNIPTSDKADISAMSEWKDGLAPDAAASGAADYVGWASQALDASNPLWATMLTAGRDVIGTLVGGTPSDIIGNGNGSVFEGTEILNFNPLTDRLLIPVDPENAGNLVIRVDENGHDLAIYDSDTNEVIAYIDLASAEEIFGTSGDLTTEQKQAFGDALLSGGLFMDADGLTVGIGQDSNTFSFNISDFETMGSFSEDIGDGGYIFAGAWTGNYMFGDSSNGTYMGTQLNDVLFGFDITGDVIDANTGGGATFYGFSGNNLFATGTGHNLVFGGSGEDTVTYEYALGGIYVDMTDVTIDENGAYFTVTQDLEGYNVDYLWNVESIIGSIYDDTIIGNDQDNTFVSTGGDNTWTGTGGSNTFVMNGGTTTITDFSAESDTIVVYTSDVVEADNLRWVEYDDNWTLMDVVHGEIIVILDKNDGFEGAVEFELFNEDGSSMFDAPVIPAGESLGHDLIV